MVLVHYEGVQWLAKRYAGRTITRATDRRAILKIIFALLGKGVRVDGVWQLSLAAVLLAGSIGIGFWLLKRNRAMAE